MYVIVKNIRYQSNIVLIGIRLSSSPTATNLDCVPSSHSYVYKYHMRREVIIYDSKTVCKACMCIDHVMSLNTIIEALLCGYILSMQVMTRHCWKVLHN